jgi:hypothetical protein
MAIDGAVSQTAVEAWDKRWATSEGLADWLEPLPAAVAILLLPAGWSSTSYPFGRGQWPF